MGWANMKEISRKQIEKTIKEEYAEARKFIDGGLNRYCEIAINVFTGDIWSNLYLDTEHYKIYKDEDVFTLRYLPGLVKDTEEVFIEDAIEKLQNAGWTIV